MSTPNKKTRPAFAKTGLHHALAVFIKRPQAVDQIGAMRTLLSRRGDVKSLHGVQVELVVFGFLLAFLPAGVALPLDRGEVLAGHVSGDVHAVEAGRFELGELGIDRAHRSLERVEVLVDDRIRPDLAGNLLLVPAG